MRGLDIFETVFQYFSNYNNWELIRRREKISDFSTFFFYRTNKDSDKNCGIEVGKIKLNLATRFVTRIYSFFRSRKPCFKFPRGVRRSIKRDQTIIFLFSPPTRPKATERLIKKYYVGPPTSSRVNWPAIIFSSVRKNEYIKLQRKLSGKLLGNR